MRQHLRKVLGYNIWYVEEGDLGKSLLLLLHGLGASSERWTRVLPLLSKDFHVIAPDMVGFGYSERPEADYTIQFFVDFVKKFASEFNDGHISLIGASLGGHVAAELAIAEPGMIEKLVLVTPAGLMKEATPVLNNYIAAAMYPTFENAKSTFELMAVDPKKIDERYVRNFVNRMMLPYAKYAFLSALMGSKQAPNLSDRLNKIRAETLIIWGREDKMIPVNYAYEFQKGIPGSKAVIMEDSGHTPYVECPEEFSSIVIKFLKER